MNDNAAAEGQVSRRPTGRPAEQPLHQCKARRRIVARCRDLRTSPGDGVAHECLRLHPLQGKSSLATRTSVEVKAATTSQLLLGRDQELADLYTLIEEIEECGGAVVVRGEAGIW